MAQSPCPKCGNHGFELVENAPKGSDYKLMFVQCSSCGTVVGVTDFYNTASLLERIAKALSVKLFS